MHYPSSTSYTRRSNGSFLEQQTVQLRTREMRRVTTTTTVTTTVTIKNGSVLHWVVDTRRHMRHCVQHYDGMYPLDCDAGPMNGDNNIIQLIRGATRYYSTIYTRRRDIARTRDEEDTKVRYNDQHCEDQLYCEEE